jgi:hypothetical protein
MISRISVLFLFGTLASLYSCNDQGPWTALFNGTDLSEFVQKGGQAQYRLEDGIIVGTAVANTPNSFLCTRRHFGDFILEYKVLIDTSLNSGVQIRSHIYLNGKVHGYQVEIEDKHWRLWSGGIYDEERRGWLFDLTGNEPGRQAFARNEWNHYRVEAIGDTIKTWVNGVMCANLVDDADASGFIAFQVHNIKEEKPWSEGAEVRWKDIRIMTTELDKYRFGAENPVPVKVTGLTNGLTDAEIDEGWELLFDGISMDKWRGAHKDDFPSEGWIIEDGILELRAEGGGESVKAGDIVTREEFSDFEFSVDFKLSPGANSGIKYYVTEKEKTDGSAIGLEYQLLDDMLHPDAAQGYDGNRKLASLYDLIPAKRRNIRDPGLWNTARIVSKGNSVEHWLNGKKVLEYTRGSEMYRKLVSISKYRNWENFGEAGSGHILLQEHGNNVSFRNIKVRRL